MVQIGKYLKKVGLEDNSSPLPLLNSLFAQNTSIWDTVTSDNAFRQFMSWARRSPHVMGFLNVIATDILSDEICFDSQDPLRSTGRNRRKRAQEFFDQNNGKDVIEQTVYDLLITGIGYNWVGKLDKKMVRATIDASVDATYGDETKEFKEYKAAELYEQVVTGELGSLAKKLRHIPSTTMAIKSDEHSVVGYVQRVGVRFKTFEVDEVIPFRLMPLDGKPYPFAPMEAILSEVYLLWLISQNYVSYFENGGHPDKVFILPKEIAGSKNHGYLIETLKKYKKIQNKHGNLVFTGELTVEDLQKFESQMEHKELGLYVIGVLAMLYGIPVGRIPFLIGKAANNGDAGGLADSGYWRKISVWQSKLETGYNASIFQPYFGVSMKFRRGYLQDEVREVGIELQKTQVAQVRMELGLWTATTAGTYLGIDPEEVEKASVEKEERAQVEMERAQAENQANLIREPDAKSKALKKQQTQLRHQKSAGGKKINP